MKRITALSLLLAAATARAEVKLVRTPHDGIQPQAVTDGKGVTHVLYYKGDAANGDLFYCRLGADGFSPPIRINSVPGSAIAVGTVRGGQIALGKAGRVHVVWNGSSKAKAEYGMPVLYCRLNDAGTAFEDQRDLRQKTAVLDGGATIAADDSGNVTVAWHAVAIGKKGETERKVWVAVSSDDGKTFSAETPAWGEPTGACGCCSMRAFVDGSTTYLLYRAATEGVHRDIYLLASTKRGDTFQGVKVHPLETPRCPMSTLSFARGPDAVVAAWDTDGELFFSRIKPGTTDFASPQTPPKAGKSCKHPVIAFNGRGEMLLAWTEGTGWMRGGAFAWQVYDKAGHPTAERGRRENAIPVWGLPAAIGTADGFAIVH